MSEHLLFSSEPKPSTKIKKKANAFVKKFNPLEVTSGSKLLLNLDRCSSSWYLVCHLSGSTLIRYTDLEASIDGTEDDEIYKLNRDITEDKAAYTSMVKDASDGRSFEDLVIEYDTSYKKERPLKVYGGQHRIKAITENKPIQADIPHGVRVYFDLNRDQKVEIAVVNNTSIAVPNDLLDRMREQLIGDELRNWCQEVGLLEKGLDFADKKDPEVPTVRLARTLIVNYHLGLRAKDGEFLKPVVCKSGGVDEQYEKIRPEIDWRNKSFIEMGTQFARLHKLQRKRVRSRDEDSHAEFARKAFSLAVVAGWSFASGFLQRHKDGLKNHYALCDAVSEPDDPLNAKALSAARLQGTDPDTYRGLGTRIGPGELGRMLEVFMIQATVASKRGITKRLANAAIKSYEAKKASNEAQKATKKL